MKKQKEQKATHFLRARSGAKVKLRHQKVGYTEKNMFTPDWEGGGKGQNDHLLYILFCNSLATHPSFMKFGGII